VARPLIALTAAGVAWTLHLGVSYFVVSIGCPRRWPTLGLLIGVTIAFAAVAATVGIAAYAVRRRSRHPGADASVGEDAGSVLLGAGALLGGLFAFMIALGGLGVVALPPCLGT
jgi:hypothetical protein